MMILTLILRLSAAVLVGGLLGIDRELRGKAAGFRTYALVTLGAALATIAVVNPGAPGTSGAGDPNALSRVVQGILTGIGFLGAGVILHDAGGHVTGLTTAATIWVAAALGILCGLGEWPIVGASIVLVMTVLTFGPRVEKLAERIFKRVPQAPPQKDS